MELFRITQEKFAMDLSGNGSRLYGGRWNSEGVFALYASSSRSLALLETLAHVPAKMLQSKAYILISLYIPDVEEMQKVAVDRLAQGWDTIATPFYTRAIGDTFLRSGEKILLEVPSVIMPEEKNYVLNPLNKGMKKVKIVHQRKVVFDNRMNLLI